MRIAILIMVSLALLNSCSWLKEPPPAPLADCPQLSLEGTVITKHDFELAGLALEKYALGKLAYKYDPKLEALYSEATRNAVVSECIFRSAVRSGDVDPKPG